MPQSFIFTRIILWLSIILGGMMALAGLSIMLGATNGIQETQAFILLGPGLCLFVIGLVGKLCVKAAQAAQSLASSKQPTP